MPGLGFFATAVVLFVIVKYVYRWTCHPLRHFPGPKLAAVSTIYAMCQDIPRRSSYIKKLPSLHDRYGPVVRIEPNHLHIRDLETYNKIFCIGTPYNKDPSVYNLAFSAGSFANNLVTSEVKGHRELYSRHFSSKSVLAFESTLNSYIDKFLQRVACESLFSGPINLTLGYRSLCADIVSKYVLGQDFSALESPGFSTPTIDSMQDTLGSPEFTFGWYFPGLNRVIHQSARRFPALFCQLSKPIGALLYQMNFCAQHVKRLRQRVDEKLELQECTIKSAFYPILERGHPVLDDTIISRDAWIIFFAGTDLPATTLTYATWHLLQNPGHAGRLQAELKDAIALDDLRSLAKGAHNLEKLPFLNAVVKESLRLAGFLGKAPRVVPAGGTSVDCGPVRGVMHIPAGTIVSSAAYVYHHDPEIFGEDHACFNPDRWLVGEENMKRMNRTWMPFGRGSRDCIGQRLGWAMAVSVLAYTFRSCDFALIDSRDKENEKMIWDDAMMTIKSRDHLKVRLLSQEYKS